MLADDFDLANRDGLRGPKLQPKISCAPRRSSQTLFFHAVPASAVGTTPKPPRRLMSACLTEKTRLGPHRRSPSLEPRLSNLKGVTPGIQKKVRHRWTVIQSNRASPDYS